MQDNQAEAPESTAARVALWRAMHVQNDPPPHVIRDEIGLRMLEPDAAWRDRPDMHPEGTKLFRASIVARARFVEGSVLEQAARGVRQYVILGAGLDSFAQRRPPAATDVKVFEIDRPAPQAWKRRRLIELGYGTPDWLRFVPVDFETDGAWREKLNAAGFAAGQPAVVASNGVSLYLTRDAILATLRQAATLAAGSTFIMTFILPLEMAEPAARAGLEAAAKGARASGTPFISFFTPPEVLALAREAGFSAARCVSSTDLGQRYFAGRSDGLRPPANSEALLVATT